MDGNRRSTRARRGAVRAVVLLSGGLDSATTLALAMRKGRECHALTFDYGQRHRPELDASRRIAASLGAASHRIVRLDPSPFAGSALTAGGPDIPRDRDARTIGGDVPATYVPARNLVFLAIATGVAETAGAGEIHIGANAVDYSGYPDCRPAFLEAFERAANLATRCGTERGGVRVRAPLVDLSKAEIVRLGIESGVDYSLTLSCYDPDERGRACGRCDACSLRRRGFEEAGVADPTRYIEVRA